MEELEKVAKEYAEKTYSEITGVLTWSILDSIVINAFKAGANWQKEHLWHDAQGDDLPKIDREVIAFTQNFPNDAGLYRIVITHRPDINEYVVVDGKELRPIIYDNGGWNMPDVKYWLDVKFPFNVEE